MIARRLPGTHRKTASLIKAKKGRVFSPPMMSVWTFTPPSVAQEIAGGGGDAQNNGTVFALSSII
jgi:hypothetical protein